MKCPVCKRPTGTYTELTPEGQTRTQDYPFYQISYPGQKEYVSPRCSECLDKLMARREKKLGKRRG